MTLFLPDGHLSQAALNALTGGTLNEPQRLDAAGHLAACSECAARYTLLLTEDVLLDPPEPIAPRVEKTLRRRGLRLLANRYAAAAAAVVLAMALWNFGIFSGLVTHDTARNDWFSQAGSVLTEVQEHIGSFFTGLSDGLNGLIAPASAGARGADAAQSASSSQLPNPIDKE